jgi:hypothetical protein
MSYQLVDIRAAQELSQLLLRLANGEQWYPSDFAAEDEDDSVYPELLAQLCNCFPELVKELIYLRATDTFLRAQLARLQPAEDEDQP